MQPPQRRNRPDLQRLLVKKTCTVCLLWALLNPGRRTQAWWPELTQGSLSCSASVQVGYIYSNYLNFKVTRPSLSSLRILQVAHSQGNPVVAYDLCRPQGKGEQDQSCPSVCSSDPSPVAFMNQKAWFRQLTALREKGTNSESKRALLCPAYMPFLLNYKQFEVSFYVLHLFL